MQDITSANNKTYFSCVVNGEEKFYNASSDFNQENVGEATEITLYKSVAVYTATKEGITLSQDCTLNLQNFTLTYKNETLDDTVPFYAITTTKDKKLTVAGTTVTNNNKTTTGTIATSNYFYYEVDTGGKYYKDSNGVFRINDTNNTGNYSRKSVTRYSIRVVEGSTLELEESGKITGSSVYNSGTFTQSGGTTAGVTNYGTFTKTNGTNTSTITNRGTFTQSDGTTTAVTNYGTFTKTGGDNNGKVTNQSSGIMEASGGSFKDTGTEGAPVNAITNKGTFTLKDGATAGTIINSGVFNLEGGTVSQTITNDGVLTQSGSNTTVTNNGEFKLTGGETNVTNNGGGVFRQDGAESTSTVTNNGATFIITKGTVNNGSTLTDCVKSDVDYTIDTTTDSNKIYVGESIPEGTEPVAEKVTPATEDEEAVASVGLNNYKTLRDAIIAAEDGATITLLKSFTSDSTVVVDKNVKLDLAGYTFTSSAVDAIFVNDGAEFILDDSKTGGKIVHTWLPSADLTKADTFSANGTRLKAAINLGLTANGGEGNTAGVKFTMLGGTITANSSAISAGNHSTISLQDGCTIESNYSCGIYFGNQVGAEGLDSNLSMTGGTIRTNENSNLSPIQVSGTVTGNTTTLDISGGTIEFTNKEHLDTNADGEYTGNPNAIYASGETKLNISGDAKITSTVTGIEFRAGELNVTGGTITSTATEYSVKTGTRAGATTFGAAIAVAQHVTEKEIKVNIGGSETNIAGLNALVVSNPSSNDAETAGKVTAKITGGTLTATKSGDDSKTGNSIFADNTNVVITVNDGNFNGDVTVNKNSEAQTSTNDATIVVAGGTTRGKVQVIETTTNADTGETSETTPADAKSSLKVMGGRVTDVASANTYVATGQIVSSNGTVTESPDNGWSLTSDNVYSYVLGGTSILLTASLGSGVESLNNLIYDKANRLFGINGDAYEWNDADSSRGYYLAKHTIGNGAVTIEPQTDEVKISGTGFIDSTIITLTASGGASFGIEVDAKNNGLANISGGAGKDSIQAGARASTLDGGENDDTLVGNTGVDLFLYSAGKDYITNYTHGTDIVSLNAANLAPKISFNSSDVNFTGSDFVINVGGATDAITFKGKAEVALNKGDSVYSYKANLRGIEHIALNSNSEHGISLGAGYSAKTFDGRDEAYTTIDAERVMVAGGLTIRGNDSASSLIGANSGGKIYGGYKDDTLKSSATATSIGTVLDGGDGNDLLIGVGLGQDTFAYSAGADSIVGYGAGDWVSVDSRYINPSEAAFTADANNISLNFGGGDSLTFLNVGGGSAISLKSGRNDTYIYTKDYYTKNNEGITLAAGYSESFDATDKLYATIDASAVSLDGGIFVTGNSLDNKIFGSTVKGGSLSGGAGNDKLDVTERTGGKFVFEYTAGKDTVDGFIGTSDSLAVDANAITGAKSGNDKLTFNFNDGALVLKGDGLEKVSLTSGDAYLTKDGVVSLGSTKSLDLFASAKGLIDLTDDPYKGASITSVNAADVKKQSVTLVSGSIASGSFTFAEKNKKRDVFTYGGGSVTISGYEAGIDRLNLDTTAFSTFSVGSGENGNVSLGTNLGNVVLESLKGQEVLIHDASSRGNSYSKFVFKETGVLENKEKRPTEATILAGIVGGYGASNTIKKVFVMGGVSGVSIGAGNNKTTLDASAANGVSLYGGAKNDKLIGNTDYADMFVYSAGKDEIQNFSSAEGKADSISLDGNFNFEEAKITASKRSLKFKFAGSKNVLTIKPTKGDTIGSVQIGDTNYTYSKNAIADTKGNASLTSNFSGSYKLENYGVNNVDGAKVKKSMTFKGTEAAETLTGGTNKTKFKGGGGDDTLIGGAGKDIFFYAKNDAGNATIEQFDLAKDKLKIASGTISTISTVSGGVKFDMTSGSFTVANSLGGGGIDTSKTLIKANNTYYWFADGSGEDVSGNDFVAGALITADKKVSKSAASGFAVIDLGYSTNLVKTNIAVKVAGVAPGKSSTTTT